MLLCVREKSTAESPRHSSLKMQLSHGSQNVKDGVSGDVTRASHFLPTSRRILQFSNGKVFFFIPPSKQITKPITISINISQKMLNYS